MTGPYGRTDLRVISGGTVLLTGSDRDPGYFGMDTSIDDLCSAKITPLAVSAARLGELTEVGWVCT